MGKKSAAAAPPPQAPSPAKKKKTEPVSSPEKNTKASPAKAKASPAKTKATPVKKTKALPEKKKKAAQEKIKSPPENSKDSSEKTKAAPEKTKAAPEKTKAAPEKTKAAQEKTKAAPEKTKAAPEKTKAAPEKTKAAPEIKAPELEELPMAIVRRIVKEKLSHLSADAIDEVVVRKDAMIAFSEASRLFIHYISAAANDVCSEANRQIMNGDDVLKALEDVDFPEFVQPLKAALAEFRLKNVEKKTKKNKGSEGGKDDVAVGEEEIED